MINKKDMSSILIIFLFLSLLSVIYFKYFMKTKETFIDSISQYFVSFDNINDFDNFIENPSFNDDYINNNLLIFKRCYNVENAFAEKLLDNNVTIDNILGDIFELTTAYDICIHKYIKYTADFNEINSSITNDIYNFFNCKNKGNQIEGNVYVLFGQIPYLKDNNNSLTVQFNNTTQSYSAFIDTNNSNNGPILYVYYIIYSNYKSDYTLITNPNNTFDNLILPLLEIYKSKDNACNTKTINGYLAGCVSTTPLYNTNEAGNGSGSLLNTHINSVTSKLNTLLNDKINIDFNQIYKSSVTNVSSGVISCPNSKTLIANALNIPISNLDIATSFISNPFQTICPNSLDTNIYINKLDKNVTGYSARCTDDKGTNSTNTGNITNYLTLYFVNKKLFVSSSQYIFKKIPM